MQFKMLLTFPLILALPLCVLAQSASITERTADGMSLIEIRCKAPVLEEWMKDSPLVLVKEAGQWHQLWQEAPKLSSPLASAYQGLDKAALSTRICNERELLAVAKNMNEKGDCTAPGTIWRGFLHRQCAYRANPLVKRMLDKCDINHDGLINKSGVDEPIEIWDVIEKEQVCQRAFLVDQLSLEISDIKTRCDLNGNGRIDQRLSLIAPLMRSGKETNVRQAWKNFPEEIRNQVEAEEKCFENADKIKNIFDAVRLGDLNAVRDFAKIKSNLESTNKNGETPLIYAVDNTNPNEDVVKLLLSSGANVDAGVSGKKNNGLTALMYSAYHGNLNVMRLLIAARANTNARSGIGNTALMLAVQQRKIEAVDILLNSSADPNKEQADKHSIIYHAIKSKQPRVVGLLIDKGADFRKKVNVATDIVRSQDVSLLVLSESIDNNEEVSRLLISSGLIMSEADYDVAFWLALYNKNNHAKNKMLQKFQGKLIVSNEINRRAAVFAKQKRYANSIKTLDDHLRKNPAFVDDIKVPQALQNEIVEARITKADMPAISSRFSLPSMDRFKAVRLFVTESNGNLFNIGSAEFINGNTILTAAHVITNDFKDDPNKFNVIVVDTSTIKDKYFSPLSPVFDNAPKARLIAYDKNLDLAIMSVHNPNKDHGSAKINGGRSRVNSETVSVGYPGFEDGENFSSFKTKPHISIGTAHDAENPEYVYTTSESGAGKSGGPIYNACGSIIGNTSKGSAILDKFLEKSYLKNSRDSGSMGYSFSNSSAIIELLKKHSVKFDVSPPCLPVVHSLYDYHQTLTTGIRFLNADQSTAFVISDDKAIFIAPKGVQMGDQALIKTGSLDVWGKVIKVDSQTRLSLFQIEKDHNKNDWPKNDFMALFSRHNLGYRPFSYPVFSQDKYIKDTSLYYSGVADAFGSKKLTRTLRKDNSGEIVDGPEDVLVVTGEFDALLNTDKKRGEKSSFVQWRLNPMSSGGAIVDSCGTVQGLIRYDADRTTSVLESSSVTRILKDWGVNISTASCS